AMTYNAGDVVMLKSGGQALTVASVEADEVTCIWIGEEGDLFREKIPVAALSPLDLDEEEEQEDDEAEEGDEDEDEDHADDHAET
ncbi:YodC family protein, partial [Stenotrophomonas maltophilia]